MKHILIQLTAGRFCNQLYPLACALTVFENNKDKYDKIYIDRLYFNDRLNPKLTEVICINKDIYNKIKETNKFNYLYITGNSNFNICTDNNLCFQGYCQNNKYIDEKIIQKYLSPTDELKQQIYNLYGDISDYICLHVRRGDYLYKVNLELYQVLTKEYIERVISKYFPNDKIICISDDIKWCKENLSNNSNIIFADKSTDAIIDFYIQTLTKANIISGSTFSTMGVLLNPNPNKICIALEPMYKHKPWNTNLNICPDYAIREQLNIK